MRTGRYVPLKYLLAEISDNPLRAYESAKAKGGCLGHALYDLSERAIPPKPRLVQHKNFTPFMV
jgi:hypothetical protein